MSINPDAHSTRELDLIHWGVKTARKGGVPKECVLNCLSKEQFAEYLENRRERRRRKTVPPRRMLQPRAANSTAPKRSVPRTNRKSVLR